MAKSNRKTKGASSKTKTKPRRARVLKKPRARVQQKRGRDLRRSPSPRRKNLKRQPARRRTARVQFRPRSKRTFQLTDGIAKERAVFKAGRGKKPKASTENAKKVLQAAAKKAKAKFSRKKGDRYAARITLRWKGEDGKWRSRSIVHVSADLETAIEKLLQEEEINSLTYEVSDGAGGTETKKIHSKEKKIVGVSFDKYVERKRKISKTSPKKRGKKKARRI